MDQKKTEAELQVIFRPLSEGLGFHPFSDGLPYAPVGKGVRPQSSPPNPMPSPSHSQGVGALQAGPPQIVLPKRPPNPRPSIPQISVPIAKKSSFDFGSIPLKDNSPAASAPTQSPLSDERGDFGGGYVLKRVFAYFLDTALNSVLCFIGLVGFVIEQDISLDSLLDSNAAYFVLGFVLMMNWILIAVQEFLFKTSVGKRIFGLKLAGGRIQCLLRALFFLPSAAAAGIGLVVGCFDSKKRCWHDRQTNLQPFEFTGF